eukprot:CAMPEP_0206234036 /NCGR_PEP_ID=MMETSP0047_2-20121206/12351_1 /ASSEMBLY_ACC=CAM_ASM_000192 /TAXON_ID=195065 /ORGANISM="Chroomonas mesostigmatica_cf, Strain CCMP1168" /LENGTH=334 /DNA_ID=CAMNT_0053658045 /DNA_START=88 /DNA_END=1092 /DNA_ORIENTATION=+
MMISTATNPIHPMDIEEGGKQAEQQHQGASFLGLDTVWAGLGTVLASTSEWISCRSTASFCNWAGTKKSASLAQVDLRGRPLSEVTTTRRPLFLGGGVCFDVPAVSLDPKGAERCVTVGQMHEAPMSGAWAGKFYDGYGWQEASFTLFFQDLSHYGKRKDAGIGFGGQDLMGSCAPAGGGPGLSVIGTYNPENGRLTWSQPAPPYIFTAPSEDQGEGGVEPNRILGTWQDAEGRRGNLELLLCEGAAPARTYVVGDSFWARNGAEPFVYEQELSKPGPRRIGDKVFVPRALAEAAQLDQTMTVDQTMIPSGGSAARAPARLGGSIIEDANNTLV